MPTFTPLSKAFRYLHPIPSLNPPWMTVKRYLHLTTTSTTVHLVASKHPFSAKQSSDTTSFPAPGSEPTPQEPSARCWRWRDNYMMSTILAQTRLFSFGMSFLGAMLLWMSFILDKLSRASAPPLSETVSNTPEISKPTYDTVVNLFFLIAPPALLMIEVCMRVRNRRILADAEMASNGPLLLTMDADWVLFDKLRVPVQHVRAFHVAACLGLRERPSLWPVPYDSYGVEMETEIGSFVLGFIWDKRACSQVVDHLSEFMHKMREEDPPLSPVSSFYLQMKKLNSLTTADETTQIHRTFPFRFTMGIAHVALFAPWHVNPWINAKPLQWRFMLEWKSVRAWGELFFCVSYVMETAVPALVDLVSKNLLWLYLAGCVIPHHLFLMLATGRRALPNIKHVKVAPKKPWDFWLIYEKENIGIRTAGGRKWCIYAITENERSIQLVSGLRRCDAIAARNRLRKRCPHWFAPYPET